MSTNVKKKRDGGTIGIIIQNTDTQSIAAGVVEIRGRERTLPIVCTLTVRVDGELLRAHTT